MYVHLYPIFLLIISFSLKHFHLLEYLLFRNIANKCHFCNIYIHEWYIWITIYDVLFSKYISSKNAFEI